MCLGLEVCCEGPKLGLRSQTPVGTSTAPRALAGEAVPASAIPFTVGCEH